MASLFTLHFSLFTLHSSLTLGKDLYSRYVWLVDIIRRHGRITRQKIDECWAQSTLSNGEKGIPRRTFYNYRMAIADLFKIDIECDQVTNEYYIVEADEHQGSVTNWLLNSAATNELLSSARDVSDRVFIEDVPSAREHLAIVIEALRANTQLRFTYSSYTRSRPTPGIVIEPYFTKIFKQIWYVVGRNVKEDKIKTYALDRMSDVKQLAETFEMPSDFEAAEYFRDAYGIVVDQSEPRDIELQVDPMRAKYLRALPLHPSQQEWAHDRFSTFAYRMRLTQDLIQHLLSLGPSVTVVRPKELRAMLIDQLQKSLKNYQ